MDKIDQIIRNKSEYKESRNEKYRHDSKERLSKILRKKVETTMIGAISSIEDHFSFLWTSEDSEMTDEKKFMYEIFQKVGDVFKTKPNIIKKRVNKDFLH